MAIWTPSQITTALWLDASDAGTITIDTGVSQWADKSGNNRNAAQTTASLQPAYSANAVVFAEDWMTVPTSAWPAGNYTLIAMLQSSTTGGSSCGLINIDSTPVDDPEFRTGIGDQVQVYLNGGYVINFNAGLTSEKLVAVEFTAGIKAELFVSGTAAQNATRSGTLSPTSEFSLGRYSRVSQTRNGSIRELIVIQSDATTRMLIEGYLSWKWDEINGNTALVTALRSDHLYKSAAPTILEGSADITSIASITVEVEKIITDSVQLTSFLDASIYGLKESITDTDIFAVASSTTIGAVFVPIFEGFTNITSNASIESFGIKQTSSLTTIFADAESISFVERNNVKIETWFETSELINEFTSLSALVDTYQATSCLTREFTSISTLR